MARSESQTFQDIRVSKTRTKQCAWCGKPLSGKVLIQLRGRDGDKDGAVIRSGSVSACEPCAVQAYLNCEAAITPTIDG